MKVPAIKKRLSYGDFFEIQLEKFENKHRDELLKKFVYSYLGRVGVLLVELLVSNNIDEGCVNKLLCSLFMQFFKLDSNEQLSNNLPVSPSSDQKTLHHFKKSIIKEPLNVATASVGSKIRSRKPKLNIAKNNYKPFVKNIKKFSYRVKT